MDGIAPLCELRGEAGFGCVFCHSYYGFGGLVTSVNGVKTLVPKLTGLN